MYLKIFILFIIFIPFSLHCEEILTLTLEICIEKALNASHEIKEATLNIKGSETQILEASSLKVPQIQIATFTGVVPGAKLKESQDGERNILETESTSRDIFHDLNIFTRTEIDIIQPLYTFGKIESLIESATKGVELAKNQIQITKSEVILKTKELYYTLLLSEKMNEILKDVSDKLDRAEKKLKELLEDENMSVKQTDFNKLKVFRADLEKNVSKIKTMNELSYEALHKLMGFKKDEKFQLASKELKAEPIEILSEDDYWKFALENRPELKLIKTGLEIREELVKVAKSDFYPTIFLGCNFRYAYAPNQEDLNNPFIPQYFRTFSLGAALGAKLNFDLMFKTKRAKLDKAEIDLLSLSEKEAQALIGIYLDVKNNYLNLKQSKFDIESTSKGLKSATGWLFVESSNYDIGVGDTKELLESIAAFTKLKSEYYSAIYNFNLSLARLSKAVGKDLLVYKKVTP